MSAVGIIVALTMLSIQINCQLQGLQMYRSNSACHGNDNTTVNFMNLVCPAGHVVAVDSVQLGANLLSDNCPLFFNFSFTDYNTCCTDQDGTDCLFAFNFDNKYHEQCNGHQNCSNSTQHQNIYTACNASYGTLNGNYSNYMFIDFYCIEEKNVVDMCTQESKTQESSELYLWNKGFPSLPIDVTDTSCECSVEIDDCTSQILINKLYMRMTDSPTNCSQNVTIKDGDNNVLTTWTCSDYTLTIDTLPVDATYILVELNNDRNISDGKFWLGFNASGPSNITVNCPAASQKTCSPTTTTAFTSTTTVQTTTATDFTTTDKTTTAGVTSTTVEETTTVDITTTTVGQTSNDSEDGSKTTIVILGVIIALLLVTVVVLSCCLWKRGRRPGIDTEKSLLPSAYTGSKKPVVSNSTYTRQKVDYGCQADFNPPKPWTANADCQTVEWSPVSKTIDTGCQTSKMIETAEKGCQVGELIQKANAKCQAKYVVEKSNKETNTEPLTTWDIGIQTQKPPTKDRALQFGQPLTKQLITLSCQTDITSENNDPAVSDRTSAVSEAGHKHLRLKSSSHGPQTRSRDKLYKKRNTEIDYRSMSVESWSGKSPTHLEAIVPEFSRGRSADEMFRNKLVHDTKESSRLRDAVSVANGCHTVYGFPVDASNLEAEQKARRKTEIRSAIYKSFVAIDRAEERFERYLAKHSPQVETKMKKKNF